MIRLKPLPPIALTNNQPAFYDIESATAVGMVAKFYTYLQNMITDYNSLVTEINNEIENFEKSTNKNYEEFTQCVKDLIDNFIESVNIKIDLQNTTIQNAVDYMKNILETSVATLFEQALNNGDITANLSETYDAGTETLTLAITGE